MAASIHRINTESLYDTSNMSVYDTASNSDLKFYTTKERITVRNNYRNLETSETLPNHCCTLDNPQSMIGENEDMGEHIINSIGYYVETSQSASGLTLDSKCTIKASVYESHQHQDTGRIPPLSQIKSNSMQENSISLKQTYLLKKQGKMKSAETSPKLVQQGEPFYLFSGKESGCNNSNQQLNFAHLKPYSWPTTPNHQKCSSLHIEKEDIGHINRDNSSEEINSNYLVSVGDITIAGNGTAIEEDRSENPDGIHASTDDGESRRVHHDASMTHSHYLKHRYEQILHWLNESEAELDGFSNQLKTGSISSQEFLKLIKRFRIWHDNKISHEILTKDWHSLARDDAVYSNLAQKLLARFGKLDCMTDNLSGDLFKWVRHCNDMKVDIDTLSNADEIKNENNLVNIKLDGELFKEFRALKICCGKWLGIIKIMLHIPLHRDERDWLIEQKKTLEVLSSKVRHSLRVINHSIQTNTYIYCHHHAEEETSEKKCRKSAEHSDDFDHIEDAELKLDSGESDDGTCRTPFTSNVLDNMSFNESKEVFDEEFEDISNRKNVRFSLNRETPEIMLGLDRTDHHFKKINDHHKEVEVGNQFRNPEPILKKRFSRKSHKENCLHKEKLVDNDSSDNRATEPNLLSESQLYHEESLSKVSSTHQTSVARICCLLLPLSLLGLFLLCLFYVLFYPVCEDYCLVDSLRYNFVWTSDVPAPT